MGHRSITIAGLMAVVLVAALGIAALTHASATWAGAMLLLSLSLLAVAILGVIYRLEGRRAWWLGFALFGWGFAALSLAPWSKPGSLPTAPLLDALYVRVSPTKVVVLEAFLKPSDRFTIGGSLIVSDDVPPSAIPPTAGPADTAYLVGTLDIEAFRSIGHGLLTLIVACVGGFVARWFYATGRPAR